MSTAELGIALPPTSQRCASGAAGGCGGLECRRPQTYGALVEDV